MNTLRLPKTAADTVNSLGPDSMEVLNSECFCISLDVAALRQALESEIGQAGLFELIQQRCQYLFAARPVFLSHAHVTRMARVVQAVESVDISKSPFSLMVDGEKIIAESIIIATGAGHRQSSC